MGGSSKVYLWKVTFSSSTFVSHTFSRDGWRILTFFYVFASQTMPCRMIFDRHVSLFIIMHLFSSQGMMIYNLSHIFFSLISFIHSWWFDFHLFGVCAGWFFLGWMKTFGFGAGWLVGFRLLHLKLWRTFDVRSPKHLEKKVVGREGLCSKIKEGWYGLVAMMLMCWIDSLQLREKARCCP